MLLPAGANPWPNVRVARCCGVPDPVGDRLCRVLAIHAAQAGERRLLASAAAAMSRRPAFAESWRGNKKYSLGKIGHHDEDAPQRNEHSKPQWGGPY
jgi:hypothetical protein